MKKIKAFTLAEILIVISIIGLVAEATIPVLIQNTKDKITVVKVQKTYSILAQAAQLAAIEDGPVQDWGIAGDGPAHLKKLVKHMQVSKDCLDEPCLFDLGNLYFLNGSKVMTEDADPNLKLNGVILADGSFIRSGGEDRPQCSEMNPACTVYQLHTEPSAQKQTLGKNWFQFVHLYNGKLVPGGWNAMDRELKAYCSTKLSNSGGSCTTWIIHKGNLDYLKCDDLSWDKKSTCE